MVNHVGGRGLGVMAGDFDTECVNRTDIGQVFLKVYRDRTFRTPKQPVLSNPFCEWLK